MKKKARYFLVFYQAKNHGGHCIGNSTIEIEGGEHFNFKNYSEWVTEKSPDISNIIVTSIYEFKNKTDYQNYSKK